MKRVSLLSASRRLWLATKVLCITRMWPYVDYKIIRRYTYKYINITYRIYLEIGAMKARPTIDHHIIVRLWSYLPFSSVFLSHVRGLEPIKPAKLQSCMMSAY